MNSPQNNISKSSNAKLWLKRIGLLGFMFFLIKGIIWIGIFIGLGNGLF